MMTVFSQQVYMETLQKYRDGLITFDEGLKALMALPLSADDAAEELNFAELNHPKIGAVAE